MESIYDKLRARLDDLANGFPETESKVEIRLLKRLFTEEEAELYLQMSPFLEKPEDVAQRLNRNVQELAPILEHMAQKGHLFRKRNGNRVRYDELLKTEIAPEVEKLKAAYEAKQDEEIKKQVQAEFTEKGLLPLPPKVVVDAGYEYLLDEMAASEFDETAEGGDFDDTAAEGEDWDDEQQ